MNKSVEQLLKERYLWDWFNGTKQETVNQMFLRVAKKVASSELEFLKNKSFAKRLEKIIETAEEFYDIMIKGLFIPSSPQLFNSMRGIDTNDEKWYEIIYKPIRETSLSAYKKLNSFRNPKSAFGSCYSMGLVGDSIKEIYEALWEQSEIFRASGGYGANFSALRSKGTLVRSINGESSGAVKFMDLYNENTKIIALHSKLKRGANMIMLHISHPEIENFIDIKSELDENGRPVYLEHANLSVVVNNKFIEAVENDIGWELIDPHTKIVTKIVNAKDLFFKICERARLSAEPGILNEDAVNYHNPLKTIEYINSVNPCGEFIGFDKTVCNLGSINLYRMYDYKDNKIDFGLLAETTRIATHYLNNALFANDYPLEELTERSRAYRPIGLGFMGLASCFLRNRLRYGSKKTLEITKDMVEEMMYNIILKSNELSKERGNFKNYEKSDYAKGKFNFINDKYKNKISKLLKDGMCNSRLMAVAPTGSISMIASYLSEASNVSGGIEPIFSLVYNRIINPNTDKEYSVKQIDEGLYDLLNNRGIYNDDLDITDSIFDKDYYTTSMGLKIKDHMSIYEIVNDRIDMGISKTINMPTNTTTEDVMEYYLYACRNNFKGGTVYVNGTRQALLTEHKKNEILVNDKAEIITKPRRQYYDSITGSFRNERGKTFITVCFDNNKPVEVFLMDGNDKSEIIGRLMSIGLRAGMAMDEFINQLKKIGGYANEIVDNILNAIKEYKFNSGEIDPYDTEMVNEFIKRNNLILTPKGYYENENNEFCPTCFRTNVIHNGGCVECSDCDWNACSI